MSYDIELHHDGKLCLLPEEKRLVHEGGTFVLGGTRHAELNVTYNYSPFFDFKGLDGRMASETISELETAVESLGTASDDDYWRPVPENAGYACLILLEMAKALPNASWKVE